MSYKKKQYKTVEHMQLKQEVDTLKKLNRELRRKISSLQDTLHQVYISKKKYKIKYKQIKQKLQILQFIKPAAYQSNRYEKNQNSKIRKVVQIDENYLTQKIKRTKQHRNNKLQDDIISLTLPTTHSNARQNNDSQQSNQKLSKYLVHNKNLIAGKIIKSNRGAYKCQLEDSSQIKQIKQTLFDVKNELQKFIFQLDKNRQRNQQKTQFTQKINMQQRLFEICSRLQKIECIQKQQYELKTSALKSKSSSGKSKIKNGQLFRTIQDIGRDLTEWKIGYS